MRMNHVNENQVVKQVGLETVFFDFDTGFLESPDLALNHLDLLLLDPGTCLARIGVLQSLRGSAKGADQTKHAPVIDAIFTHGVWGAYRDQIVTVPQLVLLATDPEALRTAFRRLWPTEIPLPSQFAAEADGDKTEMSSDSETVPAAVVETIPAPVEGAEIDPDQTAAELWKSGNVKLAIERVSPLVGHICKITGIAEPNVMACLERRSEHLGGRDEQLANEISACISKLTGKNVDLAQLLFFCAVDSTENYPDDSPKSIILNEILKWRPFEQRRGPGDILSLSNDGIWDGDFGDFRIARKAVHEDVYETLAALKKVVGLH